MTPRPKPCSGWSSRPAPTLARRSAGRPTGGVCDGNNIAACGVPVVDTMGVRGGKIHSAEEYLIVDSLAERAALSALTILRLAERPRMSFRVRAARGERSPTRSTKWPS